MTAQPPAVPDPPEPGQPPAVPDPPLPAPALAAPAVKRTSELNYHHVLISAVAGIVIVLLAGLITYPFTHPHGSAEWADVIRSIVLAVAAMGAVPAAYVAYRKQRTTEADHELDRGKLELEQAKEQRRRDELTEATRQRLAELEAATTRVDRKDFRDRFSAASAQIGSDKAPIRLAGVYALAQLADEWGRTEPEHRQTCIDVLCAYLRMPWPARKALAESKASSDTAPTGAADPIDARVREEESRVRETILRVIASHVRENRYEDHWQANDFDLTGAELPQLT